MDWGRSREFISLITEWIFTVLVLNETKTLGIEILREPGREQL